MSDSNLEQVAKNVTQIRSKIQATAASYQEEEEIPLAEEVNERSRIGLTMSTRDHNPEGLLDREL